jgi:filamentous hemagglutinin
MTLTSEEARHIAHVIAFGHAYWKHVADANEFGELITQSTFEQLVLDTILYPKKRRLLRMNRTAFWNQAEGLLVIHNPVDPDLGTASWPTEGRDEFESLF